MHRRDFERIAVKYNIPFKTKTRPDIKIANNISFSTVVNSNSRVNKMSYALATTFAIYKPSKFNWRLIDDMLWSRDENSTPAEDGPPVGGSAASGRRWVQRHSNVRG